MSGIPSFDSKSVLIETLGENRERFETSNVILKNSRGLNAIFEIKKLYQELIDFARDPNIKEDQLGPARPKQPITTNLSPEEVALEEQNYRDLLQQYERAQFARKIQVPERDLFIIDEYIEPFDATIHATPAVKGKRWHALTKDVNEEKGGLFGIGAKKAAQ